MIDRQRILNALYAAIDDTNMGLPKDSRLERTPTAELYSKSGKLDSLGVVNLILATEERVEEEFGVLINIADQAATMKSNPFKTVDTLIEYIESRLQEQGYEAL